MTRTTKAHADLEQVEENNWEPRHGEKEVRAKYEIPEGVHLWQDSPCGSALMPYDVKKLKPWIGAFVRGKLTDEDAHDMLFFLQEIAECDYGWILLDIPLGFYDRPSDADIDQVDSEVVQIGTRSQSKNRKLQPLFSLRAGQ